MLAVFIVVSLLLWRLVHSPFGRVVKAIKQNETRARFVGYDVWRYKAAVLVLSAGLSGLAGGLFAMAQASAFPDVMSLHYSGYVVMMTLVGGGLVSLLGTGDRRRRLLPRPRRDRRPHHRLDAVVRPVCSWCSCCSSRKASPGMFAAARQAASASRAPARAGPQPQAR